MNVPLYGGQGDADYLYVFRELLLPVAREYAPQLILVSAGFDTHRNDPLAGMGMSSGAYGRLTAIVQGLAEECCPGRLAFTLEGGYDRTALTDGVAAVLSNLIRGHDGDGEMGGEEAADSSRPDAGGADAETRRVVGEVRRVLTPYWKGI
jgi:acetoin utilization deacetylase AcuC-like enzyme